MESSKISRFYLSTISIVCSLTKIIDMTTINTFFKCFCLFFLVILSPIAFAQSVKIMSYNLRFDNPQDGVNAWPNRKNKVFELIQKYDPDIIGVQEALKHQLDEISQALPGYIFIGAGRDDGKTSGEYSAIFYKKDKMSVLEQNTFWLSETPEIPGSKNWDAAITRVATWGKFRETSSGKTFLVINTHFDHIGKEARNNSARILKEKTKTLGKGTPLIISGDFNCTRDEAPYQTIMNKKGVRLMDPAPSNPPGTYCTFKVNGEACRAIDYIFHTKHWIASNYLVIQDNDGIHYPSDHLPVMVELKVK